MNITLEIVDDPSYGNKIYWQKDQHQFCEGLDTDNLHIIKDVKSISNHLYAKRPDGTWYKLVDFWCLPNYVDKQLDDLIKSGLEPYQAFEIVAL